MKNLLIILFTLSALIGMKNNAFACYADYHAEPSSVCAGQPVKLYVTYWNGATPFVTKWYNSTGTQIGTADTLIVFPGSTTFYTAVTVDAQGCTLNSLPVWVNVSPAAMINFTATAYSVPFGGSTTLNWGSTNIGNLLTASGAWSGMKNLSGSQTLTNLMQTGTYVLTGTGPCGQISQSVTVVVQNPPPTVTINPVSATICEGGQAMFTATGSQGVISYHWSNNMNGNIINVSPNVTTTYVVTVTDAIGQTATASSTVFVNPIPPTPNITAAVNGQTVTLSSNGQGTTTWFNQQGQPVATGQSFNPTTSGVYTATVTSPQGCVSGMSCPAPVVILIVNPQPPTVSINQVNPTVCAGQNINLTTTATNTVSYLWSSGATTANINPAPNTTTLYSVTVTASNGLTASASTLVTVNPLPTAQFSIPTINGLTATFSNASVTALSYSWAFGDNSGSNQQNPVHTYAMPGTYNVTLTASNMCGQVNVIHHVTVSNVIPPCNLSGTTSVTNVGCFGCANGEINLSVSGGSSPFTYAWSNGATTQDVSNLLAGTYVVTITDANSCTAVVSGNVTQPQCNEITASVGNDGCAHATVCKPNPVWLFPPTGVSGGKWYPNEDIEFSHLIHTNVLSPGDYQYQYKKGNDVWVFILTVTDCLLGSGEERGIVNDSKIYPNPSTGQITMEIGEYDGKEVEYNLMSVDGRVLEQGTQTGLKFDFSDQDPGVYFVSVKFAGKNYNGKFVKI